MRRQKALIILIIFCIISIPIIIQADDIEGEETYYAGYPWGVNRNSDAQIFDGCSGGYQCADHSITSHGGYSCGKNNHTFSIDRSDFTINLMSGGVEKNCSQLYDEGYECYRENTEDGICYVSLKPQEDQTLSQQITIIDGLKYKYVADFGTINRNNNVNYPLSSQEIPYDKISRLVGTDEYEISDVYHMEFSSDGNKYTLVNQAGMNPENFDPGNFIKHIDWWAPQAVFYPVSKAIISGSKVKLYEYQNPTSNLLSLVHKGIIGLNVKYEKQNSTTWSIRMYTLLVYKIKIGDSACVYDPSTGENNGAGTYYGSDGRVITADEDYYKNNTSTYTSQDSDNPELLYIQETYSDECLCEHTAAFGSGTKRGTFTNNALNSLIPKAREYYNQFCEYEPPHNDPVDDYCSPTVFNKTCDNGNDSTTFTIGDDESCVFNPSQINKNIYSSDLSNKKYTYEKNEYCSQTCMEKIDFELPGEVSTKTAGTYWKWEDDEIKLTGTRICQSTVDVNKFENETGSYYSDNNINSRIGSIYANGNTVRNYDYISYPLLQRLADVKKVHSEYSSVDPNEGGTSTGSTTTYCNCTESGCQSGTCTTYQFQSAYTGETFIRKVASGSCSPCGSNYPKELTASKTLTTSVSTLNNLYDNIVTIVQTKTGNVQACTDSLVYQGNRFYEFKPVVKYSYADPVYNNNLAGKEYKDTSDPNTNTTFSYTNGANTWEKTGKNDSSSWSGWVTGNNFDKNNLNYPNDINSASSSHEYYRHNNNRTTQTVRRTYRSNVFFYNKANDINSGFLSSKTGSEDYTINSTSEFGYIYPISLNDKPKDDGEKKDWHLYFTKLGVDLNTGAAMTTGRFNKVSPLNGNALNYTCYYDVDNDVTTPNKPDFFYRNISLNKFNPQGRELGKNWTTEKAKATICEIEGKTYNTTSGICTNSTSIPEDAYETPQYSFTLNPDNMLAIREYNRERETLGGYSDFDEMKIYNTINDKAEDTLSWWYTSDFIDNAEDSGYAEKADFSGRTFTAWKNVDKNTNVGPAWK